MDQVLEHRPSLPQPQGEGRRILGQSAVVRAVAGDLVTTGDKLGEFALNRGGVVAHDKERHRGLVPGRCQQRGEARQAAACVARTRSLFSEHGHAVVPVLDIYGQVDIGRHARSLPTAAYVARRRSTT